MSILAIDFGGTRTRAACFTLLPGGELQLRARQETPSLAQQPAQDVIARIIETARAVASQIDEPLQAIGIAAPGPLDARAGIIHHAKTLPDWQDVPLAGLISMAMGGIPTFMENDANLGAVAEYHAGTLRGCDPAIYLTISTGLGGGLVIGGQLFAGWRGLAIEPGHMRFKHLDGQVYRLEELASGTALGVWAERRLREDDQPSVLRAVPTITGQAVGQAAQQGDPLALAVLEEAGFWLGLGLVNLLHLFNPQAIAVGGSVAQLGDLIFAPARRALQANLLDPAFYMPDLIRPAAIGEDVCLYGAAYNALTQITQLTAR